MSSDNEIEEKKESNKLENNQPNNENPKKPRKPFIYEQEMPDEKHHIFKTHEPIYKKFEIIKDYHLRGMLFECETKLTELKLFIQNTFNSNEKQLNQFLNAYDNHPRIILILKQLKLLKNVLHLMTVQGTDSPWTVFSKGEWLTEYYQDKNSTYNSFRITGIAKSPLFNVLSTLYEFDLMNNWMPIVKKCKQYNQLSLVSKTGMVKIGLIKPFNYMFSDRLCNIYAFGCDDMDNNNRLICYFDSKNNHKYFKFPPINKGDKRINLKDGGFYFEKISENETKLIATWNIDVEMKIPAKIFNWAAGKVASWLLGGMVNASKFDKNSEYFKRINNDPEFYGLVKYKLNKNNQKNNKNNEINENETKHDEIIENMTENNNDIVKESKKEIKNNELEISS